MFIMDCDKLDNLVISYDAAAGIPAAVTEAGVNPAQVYPYCIADKGSDLSHGSNRKALPEEEAESGYA